MELFDVLDPHEDKEAIEAKEAVAVSLDRKQKSASLLDPHKAMAGLLQLQTQQRKQKLRLLTDLPYPGKSQ